MRSMATSAQQVPRVHTATVRRVERQPGAVNNWATRAAALLMEHAKKLNQRCRKKAGAKVVPSDVPARNTRSPKKESAAKEAIRVRSALKETRESTTMQTQQSRLLKSTASSRDKMQKGAASAVVKNQRNKKLSARKGMQRLENEVQQAMAVMDANTDRLLNYKCAAQSAEQSGKFFRK